MTSLPTRAEAAGLRVLATAAWPESPTDRVPPPIPGFVISTFSPLASTVANRCLTRASRACARDTGVPAALAPTPDLPTRVGPADLAAASDLTLPAGRAAARDTAGPADLAYTPDPTAPAAGSPAGRVGSAPTPALPAPAGGAGAPDTGGPAGAATTSDPMASAAGSPAGRAGAAAMPALPASGGGGVVGVVVVSRLGDLGGAVHVAEVVDRGGRLGPLVFFQAVPNAVAGHVAARWGLSGPVVCVGDSRSGVEVAAGLVEDGDADHVLVIKVDQDAGRAAAVLVGARDCEGAPL